MRAIEFIIESYPLAKKEFSQVADPSNVQATIDQYRELVRKNQFRNPNEKNINYWRRLGWEAFSQMVKLKSSDISDTQRKRGKVVGNAIILQDDAEWTVVIPLDKEASVYYGKGTEWCTTKPLQSYFEDYVYRRDITLIYAIDKTNAGRSVAISVGPDSEGIDMFNQQDDPIDAKEYTEISGLDSEKFIKMATLPETQKQTESARENYKVADKAVKTLLSSKPIDPDAMERALKITKNSTDCYFYIMFYGKEQNKPVSVHSSILVAAANYVENRDPVQLAPTIGQYIEFSAIPSSVFKSILRSTPSLFTHNFIRLTSNQRSLFATFAASAYQCAVHVLRGKPFPPGEPAIATDAKYSYLYATDILNNKRFPAGEAAIATDAKWSSKYAADVITGPFPLGEKVIATSAKWALNYAQYALDGNPFPAGEPAIATDAYYSYMYAVHALDGNPFPAGEAVIFQSEDMIDDYTSNILRYHRSITWENLIKDDAKKSFNYAVMCRRPFPAGELAILSDTEYTVAYTSEVLANSRSETWEQLIKDNPKLAYLYARERNDPFPEGEAAIGTDPFLSTMYASYVLDANPFPAGELAISKSNEHAKIYMYSVLVYHRSLTWENLIKNNPTLSLEYAKVRKERFPAGEAAIATDEFMANWYDEQFGTNLSR